MQLDGLFRRIRRRMAARRLPRFVFVVTYGRSGSTLTQGLLNTLPRALVRGENDLYVLPLYRAWAQVRAFKKLHDKHARKGSRSAFYGLDEMHPGEFVACTRGLMIHQLLGSVKRREVDVLGFKEVLWHRVDPEETETFFEFFDKVFPGALYVLNRRDHARVSTSGFWRQEDPDEVLRAIQRVEDIQDFLVRTRPERTLRTQYELLTSDDPQVRDNELRGLAEFVHGSCDDALLARMRATLAEGHGPLPFGQAKHAGEEAASKP